MRCIRTFLIALMLALPIVATAGDPVSGFTNLRGTIATAGVAQPWVARPLFQFCTNLDEIESSQVTRTGNAFTVTVTMVSLFPDVICFATPPPAEAVDFPLGTLAEGEYTLVLQPINPGVGVTYLPLNATFSVGPAVQTVPTLSSSSMLVLTALLMLVAALVRRRYSERVLDE